MSYNPHDWSDGIPDCIIFASTADAERGAAMYRSMADALDAQAERIKALKGALKHERSALALVRDRQCRDGTCHVALADINKGIALLDRALLGEK